MMRRHGADWFRERAREKREREAGRRNSLKNSIRRDMEELEALISFTAAGGNATPSRPGAGTPLLTRRGIGRGGPTWTQPAALRFTAWGRSWSRCGAVFQKEAMSYDKVST